jgi:hypothetical protein
MCRHGIFEARPGTRAPSSTQHTKQGGNQLQYVSGFLCADGRTPGSAYTQSDPLAGTVYYAVLGVFAVMPVALEP